MHQCWYAENSLSFECDAPPPEGWNKVVAAAAPVGYYFTHKATNSFIVVNRLLAASEDVSWLANGPMGAGTFYVAANATALPILQKAASELGVAVAGVSSKPTGEPIRSPSSVTSRSFHASRSSIAV